MGPLSPGCNVSEYLEQKGESKKVLKFKIKNGGKKNVYRRKSVFNCQYRKELQGSPANHGSPAELPHPDKLASASTIAREIICEHIDNLEFMEENFKAAHRAVTTPNEAKEELPLKETAENLEKGERNEPCTTTQLKSNSDIINIAVANVTSRVRKNMARRLPKARQQRRQVSGYLARYTGIQMLSLR
ncbi:MAG: hypothetical protein U5J82_03485 [Desulfobacterales bacterium]|nr:hypothetical protein [Desulfobacterales bacterium]